MRIWTNRYQQDQQRLTLALRMRSFDARTHTIVEWTGLSYARVRGLVRSYPSSHGTRPAASSRGPSPSSVCKIVTSRRWRAETAGVAGICVVLGVFPKKPLRNARKEFPNPARGELLCRAFQLNRLVHPHSEFTFEQLVMLTTSVAGGSEVQVIHCESCGGVILGVRHAPGRRHCTQCEGQEDLQVLPERDID